MPSGFSGNAIAEEILERDGHIYFYIYISPEFVNTLPLPSCSDLGGEITLGSVDKRILVSNKKLEILQNQYENNYNSLKTDFNITSAIDFGISSDGYVLEKLIPENVEVMSRVYTHEVFFSKGSIVNEVFIFKVW